MNGLDYCLTRLGDAFIIVAVSYGIFLVIKGVALFYTTLENAKRK